MKGLKTRLGLLLFCAAFFCFSAIGAVATKMMQTGIIYYFLLIVGFSIAGAGFLLAGFQCEGMKGKILSEKK